MREIAIARGGFFLSKIVDDDRDSYVELQRQIVGESSYYINPISKDIMWQSALDRSNLYGIFDEAMAFIGTVELSDDTRTPEIGIAIMKEYRNRGIARIAVELLIELTYKPDSIDHYVIRIKSDNVHSRHLFESMGAEYVGEELSEKGKIQEFVKSQSWDFKLQSELSDIFNDRKDDVTVLSYKLDPLVDRLEP